MGKGSAVADGLKNSMMVPVETYIDDDATFVVDTVNSDDFLLFVSALFADEDMARMLQNAPPLRPDVKEPLDAYYKARKWGLIQKRTQGTFLPCHNFRGRKGQ